MQGINDNPKFTDSYHFSNINQEDLKIIQQAENQLNQREENDVVLIAYNKNRQ